jgi:hypothetical protein
VCVRLIELSTNVLSKVRIDYCLAGTEVPGDIEGLTGVSGCDRTAAGAEGELDLYKSQLGGLQTTLGRIRVMLLARQSILEAGRVQLSAVSQWMGALRQTR